MNQVPVLFIQGGIYEDSLQVVDQQLQDYSDEHVYVLIQTDGGDPNAGYRMIKLIQAKFKKVTMIVPSECMSTGTLIALGADEIYMRQSACLGPLDTRIRHPEDGSRISSIDVRDTASTITGLVDSAAVTFVRTAMADFELGKADAAKLAFTSATDLFQPIADKIDPYHLQASVRSATLGQKYAEALLVSRMMRSRPKLAELVSRHLANGYSSHSYAITLDEATGLLALKAEDVAKLNLWEKIKPLYNANDKNRFELVKVDIEGKTKEQDKSAKKEGGK